VRRIAKEEVPKPACVIQRYPNHRDFIQVGRVIDLLDSKGRGVEADNSGHDRNL